MKPRLNQKGQAAVEYVLLTVLSVAIVIAVSGALFTPIKKWTDFFLGTYVTCLLDYGVLPGNSGGGVSECQKQAIQAGMAGSGQFGNGASSGSNNASSDDAAKKAAAAAEADRANSAAHRRGARGNARANSVVNQRGQKVDFGGNQGTGESSTGENNTSIVRTSEPLGRYGRNSRWSRHEDQRIRARGIAGIGGDELEKIARSGDVRVIRSDSDLPGKQSKKFLIHAPPPKSIFGSDEQDNKFSFGSLFRMFMMSLIIVAVIYVVGIQVNSISKSMN